MSDGPTSTPVLTSLPLLMLIVFPFVLDVLHHPNPTTPLPFLLKLPPLGPNSLPSLPHAPLREDRHVQNSPRRAHMFLSPLPTVGPYQSQWWSIISHSLSGGNPTHSQSRTTPLTTRMSRYRCQAVVTIFPKANSAIHKGGFSWILVNTWKGAWSHHMRQTNQLSQLGQRTFPWIPIWCVPSAESRSDWERFSSSVAMSICASSS